MKIAIIVGHNPRAQGAVRVSDGRTEFAVNSELADRIGAALPKDSARVFKRSPEGGYSAEIARVYAAADKWGADCTVELHFNGAANPAASGCLTLTSGSPASVRLAALIHPAMLDVMRNRDRGVEVRPRGGRGGASLFAGRAPAVLIEPYFGSNAADCARADAADLAGAIAAAAQAFCLLEGKGEVANV